MPESKKVAVLISKETVDCKSFSVHEALSDKIVFKAGGVKSFGRYGIFQSTYRLDFSKLVTEGSYYIKSGSIKSPLFKIGHDVYAGTADFILKYMRQQRCGYNPFLKDSCHTHDGFIVDHPKLEGTFIDATGGWHDATDYLQYVTTSANAAYQLLFAYKHNPKAYGDKFDKDGNPGSNGIPDILDEAKWGLDWLVKMNPKDEMMFNQIADDRDHAGYRLPTQDKVNYGKGEGLGRPVYYCTGKVQGLGKYKNRATGIASTAGKFSSSFSLGSEIMQKYYPEFSKMLKEKALQAYEYGKKNPGVCQTASVVSPYFYEEDNYADDMELAAAQLEKISEAAAFGEKEPVTPWMGADTANHYQWYPFLNLGHYLLAASTQKDISKKFIAYFKKGIDNVHQKGKDNPFLIGVPFIWCSNNLVSAMITQMHLYRKMTGDQEYAETEAALRDWLFGCNPWGTSMIVGLPEDGISPKDPHSSLWTIKGYKLDGGLVDGPVYSTIFNKLAGLKIVNGDEYAGVQPGRMVYHDDSGDYSTNEPTMDGTASLSYYLSAMETEGQRVTDKNNTYDQGAIIRGSQKEKNIYLVFTGGDFSDGLEVVRNTLKQEKIKASFFFTGDFYRNTENKTGIINLLKDGHYLGAHSDKHLLYAAWNNQDSLLVSKEQFTADLKNNYAEMEKFGITAGQAKYFLPPYEWYNQKIAEWCGQLGLKLVNFSFGTYSNADYTTPSMGEKYLSSNEIYDRIISFEKNEKNGLNGFILLSHVGTAPERKDKFYNKLGNLIRDLKSKGYSFRKIDF